MPGDDTTTQRLYTVYLEGCETALDPGEFGDARCLSPELYLVRTDATQSRLYHAVKHATRPQRLFVAPVTDTPKFKGMEEGALKWLRSGNDH